nr:putative transposase (putative), gypsy type [Tanacetum cinerariifolium]
MGRDTVQLEIAVNTISQEYLLEFTSEYGIPKTLHLELPGPEDRIVDFPEGKVGVYTRFFEFANFCFPISQFLFDVLGWMSFSKRPGKNTPQCYTKPLDSLKNWNNRFFWVDESVFPTVVDWRTNAPRDGMPAESTYSIEVIRALDTHRTPIQKQPEMLLCLVGISRRYYLRDEVYLTFLHDDDRDMDLFNLIRAPNPTKVKTGSRPRAPNEVPLLTLTATRVIEMDDPATATDSSEIPPSVDVPATDAPGASQAEVVTVTDPPAATESHKRGRDGTDVNAPPKSLRRDHADPRPTGSSHGGKSLAAIQLGLPSSQRTAATGGSDSENASSPVEVGSPKSIYRPEWGVANGSLLDTPEACQDLVDHVAPPGYLGKAAEEVRCSSGSPGQKNSSPGAGNKKPGSNTGDRGRYEEGRGRQECWANPRIRRYACPVLESPGEQRASIPVGCYPTRAAIAGRRWVIGHGLRLAVMKCDESLEMRQVFTDVVSAGIAKALQALKDLKYPLVDQLEGLKDAPMDVIMDALYLESDTRDDASQYSCREEEKMPHICRTHGVGSAHHARSDGVSVSVPTVVPQGLALLLADAATLTEFEDT